jgi:hypothetical protein
MPCPATKRTAVQLIETDAISVIGPTTALPLRPERHYNVNKHGIAVNRLGSVPGTPHSIHSPSRGDFGRFQSRACSRRVACSLGELTD